MHTNIRNMRAGYSDSLGSVLLFLCPSVWDLEMIRPPVVAFGSYSPDRPGDLDPIAFLDEVDKKFPNIDAVASTHDFPGCVLAACVAKGRGLPGADPRTLLRAQHKAMFRAQTGGVEFVSCTLDDAKKRITLPAFVRPTKSVTSRFAERIDDAAQLDDYLSRVETHLDVFMSPFRALWSRYGDDDPLAAHTLIAEEIVEADQVTVEGFVHNGAITIMGTVDSIMIPGTRSFARFDYPSSLAVTRLEDEARRVVKTMGLDNTQFNVELFTNGQVIELNTRMSYQFSDMFEHVDGTNSYDILFDLARGHAPKFERRAQGYAGSFVLRVLKDAVVKRIDVDAARRQFPDARIFIFVKEGMRLSDVAQDAQSFRYGVVNVAARTFDDAKRRFEEIRDALSIEMEEIPA
jgi:hypothetical protein